MRAFRKYSIIPALLVTLFLCALPHSSAAASMYGAYWEVPIVVSAGNDSNTVYIGGDVTATASFENRWETRAMLSGNLAAYFYAPEYGLSTNYFWSDFRNLMFPQNWVFYVAPRSSGASITLNWSMANAPQNGVSFSLTDTVSGTVIDMFAQSSYAYTAPNNASREFRINAGGAIPDSTPPETQIVSISGGANVTFAYSGTDDISSASMLTYSISVDGGAWSAYSSLTLSAITGLSEGAHVFAVAAMDVAGNVDLTPAETTYVVDATPPVLTLYGSPNHRISRGSARPGATAILQVRGNAKPAAEIDSVTYDVTDSYGKYTSAGTLTVDAYGNFTQNLTVPADLTTRRESRVYTVTVTAKDKSGNTSSATRKVYVGVRPPAY